MIAVSAVVSNLFPVVGVVFVAAFLWWQSRSFRRWIAGRPSPPGSLYMGLVRPAVRDVERGGEFSGLGNGMGGFLLTVMPDLIEVKAVGGFPRLARLFRMNYTFKPTEVTMSLAEVGRLRLRSGASRTRVVLSGARRDRRKQVALYPEDGDLTRLQSALSAAGVQLEAQMWSTEGVSRHAGASQRSVIWRYRLARLAVSAVLVVITFYRTHDTFGPGTILFFAIIAGFDVYTWNRGPTRRR